MHRATLNLMAFSFVLSFATGTAHAYASTVPTRITRITAYSEYGGGDVAFTVANPLPECSGGFWFKKTDAGFQATLTTLLSAYHARSTVRIYAHPDQLWPGSASNTCRLYGVDLL